MNKVTLLISSFCLVLSQFSYGAENCTQDKKTAVCTEDIVKERVAWACDLIEKKGKSAVLEISRMRYECCGEPNYVWINDMLPKMIMHPMKSHLNGASLSSEKDPHGKLLFVEFVKAVKAKPSGSWVDYEWEKYGEKVPSAKSSWVKKCTPAGTKDEWVVGSGTWK